MNNKGFTLIELLAVIVILAIIALIATPIVLNIINDSRASAIDRTAELVGDEVELAYASYMMSESGDVESFCSYMDDKYFQMDGAELETCAAADGDDPATVEVKVNNNTYTATYADGVVTITYTGGNDSKHCTGSNNSCSIEITMKKTSGTTPGAN